MSVNFVNIPTELKQNASFCLWKKEKRGGRVTKVPYNPSNGTMAKTNDASTFSDFATAMKAYAMGGWDGIGFRVSEGIGAIDIDHCIREDGTLNDVAASILGFFPDSYFERSPSGTGLRGFFKLSPDFAYDKTVYYINNRKHGLEVYLPGTTNRFVTVTGDMYRPGAVERNDEGLATTLDTFMKRKNQTTIAAVEPCSYLTDEQVMQHALKSESGDKFKALYNGQWEDLYDSQSDADMALVSMLAFWCGNVEEQIDRIFRESGLMREKWDRHTGDSTYGQITIRNAVSSNSTIYTPVRDVATSAEDEFSDLDDPEDEEKSPFRPALSFIKTKLEDMKPHTNPRYQRDEIGIGNAFADYFKPIARFAGDRNIWYVYDGVVWQPDDNALAVAELAKVLADRLYSFALQIKDEDTRNRYTKRVQKLQLRKHRKTMLEDAKSVHPVKVSMFDRNKYLFNCANGTLDLSTLEFRPHDPEDFITKVSPINYDPDAICPRWNRFIDEIMQGKAPVSRYLQKAIGYTMTGDSLYTDVPAPVFKKAIASEPMIPHSFCSPELLAHILYEKYVMAVPLERQSKNFKAMGMRLSTATLSNWVLHAAEHFMKPVYERMKAELLTCSVIHADETVVQVLNEPNKKAKTDSRMWVYCAGKYEKHSNILFEYTPTRNGDNAQKFLTGYRGYVVCDGYDGYNKLIEAIRCGCWAHARRKFVEALPTDEALLAGSAAAKGVETCNEVFILEREFEGKDERGAQIKEPLTANERQRQRQGRLKPILDGLFAWLNDLPVSGGTKLAKAVQYCLNEKTYLYRCLEDGNIPVDNNRAENAIRPFVVGRKNWLFANSVKGAQASAIIYSLAATATANGLNVEKYFTELCKMKQILPWKEEHGHAPNA